MHATCGEQALLALDGEKTPVMQDQKENRQMGELGRGIGGKLRGIGTELLIGLSSDSLLSIK